MKNKFLICLIITVSSLTTFSQTDETGRVSFGVRAGINFQNLNGKDGSGNMLKNNLVPRYHLGINVEIPIVPDICLQPNLLFSTKGASSNNAQFNISYVELPINLIYKPLLGKGHLMLGFGPYLAYAVGGKVTFNGGSEKIIFKSSRSNQDLSPVLKPFDAGGNMLFGYEFASKISLQLNVQLGLVNINPKNDSNPGDQSTLKNTGFGLSAGYRF